MNPANTLLREENDSLKKQVIIERKKKHTVRKLLCGERKEKGTFRRQLFVERKDRSALTDKLCGVKKEKKAFKQKLSIATTKNNNLRRQLCDKIKSEKCLRGQLLNEMIENWDHDIEKSMSADTRNIHTRYCQYIWILGRETNVSEMWRHYFIAKQMDYRHITGLLEQFRVDLFLYALNGGLLSNTLKIASSIPDEHLLATLRDMAKCGTGTSFVWPLLL